MRVSQLNIDGVFLHSYDLDESDRDPLEPERYLIPGGCVIGQPAEDAPHGYVNWFDLDESVFKIIPNPYPEIEPTAKVNTEEMGAEEYARYNRDNMLASTDWTQLPDVPKKTRDLYRPYRQALRDVPQQDGFPMKISWPVNPAGLIPEPEPEPEPEPDPE